VYVMVSLFLYCTFFLSNYMPLVLYFYRATVLLHCFSKPGMISSVNQVFPGEDNDLFSVLFLSDPSP
jgi:hypothetical protein